MLTPGREETLSHILTSKVSLAYIPLIRSSLPHKAGTVIHEIPGYHRLFGEVGFVPEEDNGAGEAKDQRHKDLPRAPAVLNASPSESEDGQGGGNDDDEVATIIQVSELCGVAGLEDLHPIHTTHLCAKILLGDLKSEEHDDQTHGNCS